MIVLRSWINNAYEVWDVVCRVTGRLTIIPPPTPLPNVLSSRIPWYLPLTLKSLRYSIIRLPRALFEQRLRPAKRNICLREISFMVLVRRRMLTGLSDRCLF